MSDNAKNFKTSAKQITETAVLESTGWMDVYLRMDVYRRESSMVEWVLGTSHASYERKLLVAH